MKRAVQDRPGLAPSGKCHRPRCRPQGTCPGEFPNCTEIPRSALARLEVGFERRLDSRLLLLHRDQPQLRILFWFEPLRPTGYTSQRHAERATEAGVSQ